MATVGLLLQRGLRFLPQNMRRQKIQQVMFVRNRTATSTGAMLAHPEKNKLGLTKLLFVIIPFGYIGATMSKEGAAFLEENDIFVPDDDDD